jgi:hypothetical protein
MSKKPTAASNGRKTKRIDLSAFRDVDVKSFEIRLTDGNDTLDAAIRCIPPDGQNVDPNLFGVQMRQQLLAGALVAVNDQPVNDDGQQSISWGERTRQLLGMAYDYHNGLTQKERDLFQSMLEGKPAPTASSATPSSGG